MNKTLNKARQIVEVLPYNPDWPKQFAEEASLIKPTFADNFAAIHHIGSTSVPGLAAKPTIDILLEVKDIERVDQCNNQMAELGYEAWGEYNMPGRRFFVKGAAKRTHHVHTFQVENPEIARHFYFRDYLKTHPNEAQEYANLKIKLAGQFMHNRQAYIQNKQDFVKALEQKEIQWALRQKY